MAKRKPQDWPVLKTYSPFQLARIALPLGGIGTGTVSLAGRGTLCDWEIVNRPAKGFIPEGPSRVKPFFALFAKPAGQEPVTRLLEGPLEEFEYEGSHGSPAPNHGLPRFRECAFMAAYPFGQVVLKDEDVPLQVTLQAFSPMVPADPDDSGIPVAVLRFVLDNRTGKSVNAAVCGSVPNFIGEDGSQLQKAWCGELKPTGARGNRNELRRDRGVQGVFMRSEGVEPHEEQWGTMALATAARGGVSTRTDWARVSWGDSLLEFWDDFGADGSVTERAEEPVDKPMASVAVRTRLQPRATRTITFLLTWHFPNRYTWTPRNGDNECCNRNRIGNYYTTQYEDAWDVAVQVAKRLPKLEERTVRWVRSFCESDLPDAVKEAALFNTSTLRTQTCFRTPDGRFYGWEGCCNRQGCCLGSCTHVWNYEQATAFLYGGLARTMREVEFNHATTDEGLMSFRVHLPLERANDMGQAAADGQMGSIMKMYREWQLSGDEELLRQLWPKVRQTLEFCWLPGGWDADKDGVMEGCQHNTMDVEYYGPNPQMGTWYLGALRAAEEMARYLGETDFAQECRDLFEKGSAWIDENLFNGEYYEHQIWPTPRENVRDGLQIRMGAEDSMNPVLQLGAGCLVDQLVGQFMAHVCGLGYLLDRRHVRKTLKSIMKYNFKRGFHDHFNHMRSFALGDELALLMATYPLGRRPKRPFPYYNEVMTGFEYTAAVHMLYEGQERKGHEAIMAIRNRYDGAKRSPFDEAECGHHYARAMASWGAVLALSGFHYSAVEEAMQFGKPGRFFWSTGDAWGTCEIKEQKRGTKVSLQVGGGRLPLKRLLITDVGAHELERGRVLTEGKSVQAVVKAK